MTGSYYTRSIFHYSAGVCKLSVATVHRLHGKPTSGSNSSITV